MRLSYDVTPHDHAFGPQVEQKWVLVEYADLNEWEWFAPLSRSKRQPADLSQFGAKPSVGLCRYELHRASRTQAGFPEKALTEYSLFLNSNPHLRTQRISRLARRNRCSQPLTLSWENSSGTNCAATTSMCKQTLTWRESSRPTVGEWSVQTGLKSRRIC